MNWRSNQFIRFCAVGTIGFITDSSVLLFLTQEIAVKPVPGRIVSFVIAATVTWILNRIFTFEVKNTDKYGEWAKYLMATAIGGGINFSVYKMWLVLSDTAPINLLIGVGIGSIVAMSFNFFVAKRFIFHAR